MKMFFVLLLVGLILVSGCTQETEVEKSKPSLSNLTENFTLETAKETINESVPEKLKKEELVSITFKVNGKEADQVSIQFPVFWAEYRMPSVKMEKKIDFFEATVNLPKNGLVRYEYVWEGKPWEFREQFRQDEEANRMVHVTDPLTIEDKIYSWGPKEVERAIKISGKILDKQTLEPILDAVIVADGIITLPTGDGSYELNIRQGKHQVVVYLLDGSYKSQSKIVDIIENKELNFDLEKAKPMKVKIKIDANPPEYHEVRMYSSAEQTGPRFLYKNRFLTENFKEINKEIELDLYEGQYVDYLYTVGNPYVSFENKKGEHIIRNFIAEDSLIVEDNLGSFLQNNTIDLTVKVPEYTDPKDFIGLKNIHPTPVFLHPKGNNEWTLKLNGNINPSSEYRYYKSFAGDGDEKILKRTLAGNKMNDIVEEWKLQNNPIQKYAYTPPQIKNKFEIFIYPYDYYGASHSMLMESIIDRASGKGFHGISLSQIWGYETLEPKLSRYNPSTLYMPFFEVRRVSDYAHKKGLKIIMFPQLVGAESLLGEGNEKTFDSKWWDKWLGEMEKFNLYNTRTAEAARIEFLMFQGRQPGMNLPEDYKKSYNKRQKEIFKKMKSIYSGKIIAAADRDDGIDYWKDADIVSEKIWDKLVDKKDPTQEEIDKAVENLLDDRYKPIYLSSGKPFLIDQLAYGSVDGGASGITVPESDGQNTDTHLNYPLDLEEQRMAHEAFYKAINERDWIIGVNLFGYGLTDTPLSRDVNPRSKPAEDVASSWAKKISESN